MQILPIFSISKDDQIELGLGPVHLGILKRARLPVLDGSVIFAPVKDIQGIIKKLHLSDPVDLETQSKALQKKLKTLLTIKELKNQLINQKYYLFNGKVYSKLDEILDQIYQTWTLEISTAIYSRAPLHLTNPVIYGLSQKSFQTASAFYDPQYQEVVIDSPEKIAPQIMKVLDQIVLIANQRLVLPQVYQFIIIKNQPWITKVQPFTEGKVLPEKEKIKVSQRVKNVKPTRRLALKVITDLQSHLGFDSEADGVIVSLDEFNSENQASTLLAELCQGIQGKPVFCRLPKNLDPQLDSGLSLIQNGQLMDQIARIFLTVHHTYFGHNLIMVLPEIKSAVVYQQIKQQLSAREVLNKTDLKVWIEITIPENLINLNLYMDQGVDGVILDTDALLTHLTNASGLDLHYYGKNWQLLQNFLTPYLPLLKQKQIPILVKGDGSLVQELLEFLIIQGLWGVVLDQGKVEEEIDHLIWTEQRIITYR